MRLFEIGNGGFRLSPLHKCVAADANHNAALCHIAVKTVDIGKCNQKAELDDVHEPVAAFVEHHKDALNESEDCGEDFD